LESAEVSGVFVISVEGCVFSSEAKVGIVVSSVVGRLGCVFGLVPQALSTGAMSDVARMKEIILCLLFNIVNSY